MALELLPDWMTNLEEEDVAFIKKFILASGSLKEVAGQYGVTYPTVRLRLDRLIQKSYHLLGLISYLTAGPKEVRAWTITQGTRAPQAAGKIHTDFERGFIRAEVVSYRELMENGSMNACKEKGLVRSEGKEYVMQDGDVVLFRFNV